MYFGSNYHSDQSFWLLSNNSMEQANLFFIAIEIIWILQIILILTHCFKESVKSPQGESNKCAISCLYMTKMSLGNSVVFTLL